MRSLLDKAYRGFTKDEAKTVLRHELLHAHLTKTPAQGWICHRGQDPDDVWVVDLMIDGEYWRLT